MQVRLHDDVTEFAALARPLLEADPLRHTVLLTVLDGMLRSGGNAEALVTVHHGDGVCGAALRTPRRGLLVSPLPRAAAAAVAAALDDPDLPGASGPTAEVEAFSAAHAAHTGAAVEVRMRTRLFALGDLAHPRGVRGFARLATAADLELLGAWLHAFEDEAAHGWKDQLAPRDAALRSLRLGNGNVLWEVGGEPVATASASRPVAGMSRVGSVYTPPEHRRRGFAGAVTAAASAWALGAGARWVLLFTDVANPTTNALYPRLGFRPVRDALEVRFRGRSQ